MQGSTYTQPRYEEEVGWLVLRSAAFTPGESHRYSFYRRWSGPQNKSGHEGVKNNLQLSDTRDRTPWAGSPGELSEELVTQGEAKKGLENKL